jgi:hypothetical protein
MCISRAYCENGQVPTFHVTKGCSTPLENPCSTSTCVEQPLIFSFFHLVQQQSVICLRDVSELEHLSVHDKELLDWEIGTSPSSSSVQSIMEVGVH